MHATPAGLPLGRRTWSGVLLGAVGLTGLTVPLVLFRPAVELASVALLYLIPVVAVAVVGGLRPALAAALTADLLVNYFFAPPYHTLRVESRDHLILLVVYILVAAAVSIAVEVAARYRERAARRDAEAALLARITATPLAEQSLSPLLGQIREVLALDAVALLESGPDGERTVASVGQPPAERPTLSTPAGAGFRLVGWGSPRTGDEDRRAFDRLASAAARTVEAHRARELAEVDRVRSALLAAVGHDLRTPLAGVKAAVSSLRQPDLDLPAEARSELLATIEDGADRLDALIDNLLSMSRLQAGALSVHCGPVALDAVVGQALLHASGGTRVDVDIPDDLPLVDADAGLLERVVANLVANARAASPTDRPVRVAGDVDGGRVRLRVIDHGPGVPAADHDRIFEPFQRLHDRTTTGGLGLGLAIARGFSHAIGATITPSATPGGGLTMTVAMPLAGQDRQ